jgi:hypothetical protein
MKIAQERKRKYPGQENENELGKEMKITQARE